MLERFNFQPGFTSGRFHKTFSVIIYTPNLSANLRQYDTSGVNYAEKKFYEIEQSILDTNAGKQLFEFATDV